jgi:hypothetical protein
MIEHVFTFSSARFKVELYKYDTGLFNRPRSCWEVRFYDYRPGPPDPFYVPFEMRGPTWTAKINYGFREKLTKESRDMWAKIKVELLKEADTLEDYADMNSGIIEIEKRLAG